MYFKIIFKEIKITKPEFPLLRVFRLKTLINQRNTLLNIFVMILSSSGIPPNRNRRSRHVATGYICYVKSLVQKGFRVTHCACRVLSSCPILADARPKFRKRTSPQSGFIWSPCVYMSCINLFILFGPTRRKMCTKRDYKCFTLNIFTFCEVPNIKIKLHKYDN